MTRWLSRFGPSGVGLASVGALGALVAAAGVQSPRPQPPPPPPPPADLRGLDAADRRILAGFTRWQRLARPPAAGLRSLGSAHPGSKVIRVNRTRAQLTRAGRQRFPYPRGTTIVKTARVGRVVTLIAIMRRTGPPGAAHGGWSWVEYKRSSASQPFTKLQASQGLCSGCHQLATQSGQRTDWAFYSLR